MLKTLGKSLDIPKLDIIKLKCTDFERHLKSREEVKNLDTKMSDNWTFYLYINLDFDPAMVAWG